MKKTRNQTNKSFKIIFLEKALRLAAVLIIKKYNPRIIGITGSVGKTSSKEAIFSVLAGHYRVRKNEQNYNNEIGLPLTVIGSESGGDSILRWAGVFLKALAILIFPVEYPEILVLEMGADRPGDIKYLTDFLFPETAVITDISGSHLEYFKTLDRIGEEKWTLVESLKSGDFAAVNIDNAKIAKLVNSSQKKGARFLTFGFSSEAEIQAKEIFYNYSDGEEGKEKEIRGLSFKLNYKGTTIPVRLNNVLARYNIYAALSAAAVGITFKLNLVEIASSFENFSLPCGRMNLIAGIKNSSIIDDTYNSSPVSATAALEVMKDIQPSRKIAVLGDMLELGKESAVGHREVAKKVLEVPCDIFFAVGSRMKLAAEELQKKGVGKTEIFIFPDPVSAGKKLERIIQKGDLILIKGSQGMRMEKVVEEVMAEPEKAQYFLCRQDAGWKSKP